MDSGISLPHRLMLQSLSVGPLLRLSDDVETPHKHAMIINFTPFLVKFTLVL